MYTFERSGHQGSTPHDAVNLRKCRSFVTHVETVGPCADAGRPDYLSGPYRTRRSPHTRQQSIHWWLAWDSLIAALTGQAGNVFTEFRVRIPRRRQEKKSLWACVGHPAAMCRFSLDSETCLQIFVGNHSFLCFHFQRFIITSPN